MSHPGSDHTIPTPGDHLRHTDRLARLERVWANDPGLLGQLTAVNHSTVSMRFIVTGFAFLLVGGLLSMFMRLQLAWPGLNVLDPERYAQFVTMHGTTMMFLFAVPIMGGFGMYLVPKMIGARDLPFPRLSSFGYWCYLFGGLFLYSSFFFGSVPDTGWFMYTPLSDATYSPGKGVDFWLIGVTFAEIAAVVSAIEMITAILITRAPGMDLRRMPLFVWAMLVTAFMIAFGFPPLILASILLEIQRAFDFAFFEVARGGDPLLWQHLFWLFGHPEVYIIFLPGAGVVSMVVQTFARRPIVGYTWVVLALVATGFLSFGLWVHHMFAVGIPLLALAFFSAASMMVAIPTGIQIFAWLATLWAGKPWLRVPMLYIIGFFVVFVCGGLTGVMLAFVPFNWQVHDTHFVVAHLHYVLIGGLMFPLFAGLYYWLPLASGRMPSESLSRSGFWLVFIGFNLAFLPMHITGMAGMPRRVDTYAMELGVHWLNLLSTAAGFVMAVGVVAILIDVVLCFLLGRRGADNPWQAGTLEWAVPSPVPTYNFASMPQVESRYPLWDTPGIVAATRRTDGLLGEAHDDRRELLGTSIQSGQPEQVIRLSGSTALPLIAAAIVAVLLAGFISSQYWLSLLMLVPLIGLFLHWVWTTGDRHAPLEIEVAPGLRLPTQASARNAPGWWALVVTLMIDSSLFASLVFAYFYLWLNATAWPAGGATVMAGTPALVAFALLALPLLASWRAPVALAAGRLRVAIGWHVLALVGGALFLAHHLPAMWTAVGAPQAHAYGAVAWTLAGFHALHVIVALLVGGFTALRIHCGHVDAIRTLESRIAVAFWRYVVAIGVITLAVLHLFPRWM